MLVLQLNRFATAAGLIKHHAKWRRFGMLFEGAVMGPLDAFALTNVCFYSFPLHSGSRPKPVAQSSPAGPRQWNCLS